MAQRVSEGAQKGEKEMTDLQSLHRQLRQDLAEHLMSVHKAVADNSEVLQSIKQSELPRVCREFLTLEQKVAKWVRTDPMPGKISEARLYSLEARVAHEMESRMLFEERQKSSMSSLMIGMSPRPGASSAGSLSLPSLSRHADSRQTKGSISNDGSR